MSDVTNNLPDEEYLLGPKTATITAGAGIYSFPVVFNSTDFAKLGVSKLGGIFALSISVKNNSTSPIYIGLQLTSFNDVVTVTDFKHIGFVGPAQSVVISGNSVPSLSAIKTSASRPIDSIAISLDILTDDYVDSGTVEVYLRITSAQRALASPERIGSDRIAFEPGFYVSSAPNDIIAGGVVNQTLITSTTFPAPLRSQIVSIAIEINPMPHPGDIRVDVCILRGVSAALFVFARIFSLVDERRHWQYDAPLWLRNTDKIRIRASNFNVACDGIVDTQLLEQIVY